MHDGMQYDPIQGQGQRSEALESQKIAHFHRRFSPPSTPWGIKNTKMCFAITFVNLDGFLTNLADCFLNKHCCVLSNSGLSNATSKRPKLAFFRGKICPPQLRNCQNWNSHTSKIVCLLPVCLRNNRYIANHISEPYAKFCGKSYRIAYVIVLDRMKSIPKPKFAPL